MAYNLLCLKLDELKEKIPNFGDKAAKFILICGDLNENTFNGCMKDDFLKEMFGFSDESITIYREIVTQYRKERA